MGRGSVSKERDTLNYNAPFTRKAFNALHRLG
jgi:hypothetical protein